MMKNSVKKFHDGLQYLERKLRNSILRTDDNKTFTHTDLDIKNSIPTILYNFLYKNKNEILNYTTSKVARAENEASYESDLEANRILKSIKPFVDFNNNFLKNLTKYIKERDDIFKQVMTYYNVNKDNAKKLFISLLNGGSYNGWLKKTNNTDNTNDEKENSIRNFILQFEAEQKIITEVIEKNKNLRNLNDAITSNKINQLRNLQTKINDLKEENKNRKKKNTNVYKETEQLINNLQKQFEKASGFNPNTSTKAIFLYTIESHIVLSAFNYLVDKGIIKYDVVNGKNIYNGISFEGDGMKILGKLEQNLIDELNVYVNSHFNINSDYKIEFVNKTMEEYYDDEEIAEIKEYKLYDYEDAKAEFELNNFKLNNPLCFIEINKNTNEFNIHSEKVFMSRYRELKYEILDEAGEKKKEKFIEKWLDDENKRVYDKIEFVPTRHNTRLYL